MFLNADNKDSDQTLRMRTDLSLHWTHMSEADFQAGPTFPTIPTFPYFIFVFLFSLLFSENTLLTLLFSQKIFEVTKNCNLFSSLASLAWSF